MLPDHADLIRHTFGSHAEPADGYNVRKVCVYGVGGCRRSEMAVEMLKTGDIDGFGELIDISHDGDRVTRLDGGRRVPTSNRYPDDKLDALIADATSGEADRQERARLWRQPGGYNVSIEELDVLVDIARSTPGVVGAGLVGAGLGGSVAAVVEKSHARDLVDAFAKSYYDPAGLEPAAAIIRPLGGAGVIDVD